MQSYLLEMLQCPNCGEGLEWTVMEQDGERIEAAEARCRGCGAAYPVRDGIGIFLTPDLPRSDLWDQMDSELARFLGEHPEIERRLMGTPAGSLSPADQFFRAMVLEERGALDQAKALYDTVNGAIYTPEYLICYESQMHYVIDQLAGSNAPVVDIASGQGELVQQMARRLERPVVATDFSLRILRRDRRWLMHFGLYDRVSLLAFDARRTPFKDGAVGTMTTNLGLANIEEPGGLLKELRRAVSGQLLAISFFYPPEDLANAEAIEQFGLSALMYRSSAVENFVAAGWEVQPHNPCQGRALPTPKSAVLEGAGLDALPVAETVLEWCTLVAE